MDFDIYNFLDLDLMEQNLVIMDLETKRNEFGLTNYISEDPYTKYIKLGRKIELLKELQDLQFQNAVYYDEWRDKWIIRKELQND